MLVSLLRQPLLHFLLLGAAIFGYNALVNPQPEQAPLTNHQILVDQATLLDFMQYRAKAFEPELFAAQLAGLSEAERKILIADYVREEALYREALAMGMDEGDYIIRQRLVQKVEFLLENLVAEAPEPEPAELQAYYEQHLSDYHVDAVYTFTHIFFDAQQGGSNAAKIRALDLLPQLAAVPFEDASQFGDRYPFLQNYVERTRDFVVNNFSKEFVDGLDLLVPAEGVWAGPLTSRYGEHLVMLRKRDEPATPPLESIRERVLDDYLYESLVQGRQDAEAKVVNEYEVIQALE